MSFVYPFLLSGLVLAGIPVLLHLIMRQKPRHLLFPAFRFLLQRHKKNQRKVQLRHLLLLALRLLLIVGSCLALARPKFFSDRLNLSSERPVAAILIFDTSPSMEYTSAGQTRLDLAKQRARELLDELPDGSKVAILDTAEVSGDWLTTRPIAAERIAELKLHPANGPVTNRLAEAYRLLVDLDQSTQTEEEQMPRFIYLFSDRAQESWDQGRLKDLEQLRDRLASKVHAVFVDVGMENPVDVALVSVELPHQVVPVNDRVILRVTVRAIGDGCDTELRCRIDGEQNADRKPVKLAAGQSQVIPFERPGLPAGAHQAELTLGTADALPSNNALFATFEVRGGRQVLILVDEVRDAEILTWALQSTREFQCVVKKPAEIRNRSPKELLEYQAICLLNVAKPDDSLWQLLTQYVQGGGGLAVVPGGEDEFDRSRYNDNAFAQQLMPGRLVKVIKVTGKQGVPWNETSFQHPIMARFREWEMLNVDFQKIPREALRYWEVERQEGESDVIVYYADKFNKDGRPALLERTFDRKRTRGHVLLYTTALDRRHLVDETPPWNDYLKNSFYLSMTNATIGYLAGDAEEARFNFQSGQVVNVPMPASPRFPTYTLQGPGLSAAESNLTRGEHENELHLAQAVTPGNYNVVDPDNKRTASFSVNVPPEEWQLTPAPKERIEELLGEGAVLPVDQKTNLREALQGHWSQPVELFPWIMILVLLALAVENLLANKFYRREPGAAQPPAANVQPALANPEEVAP
jgi:hypothetical protein